MTTYSDVLLARHAIIEAYGNSILTKEMTVDEMEEVKKEFYNFEKESQFCLEILKEIRRAEVRGPADRLKKADEAYRKHYWTLQRNYELSRMYRKKRIEVYVEHDRLYDLCEKKFQERFEAKRFKPDACFSDMGTEINELGRAVKILKAQIKVDDILREMQDKHRLDIESQHQRNNHFL
jgi:hypothetical protein